LNELEGIALPPDAITRRPTVFLSALTNEERLIGFLNVMSWLIHELRAG
jgi:hypothetical protein